MKLVPSSRFSGGKGGLTYRKVGERPCTVNGHEVRLGFIAMHSTSMVMTRHH